MLYDMVCLYGTSIIACRCWCSACLEEQKLKEGKDLIRYFCVPCKAAKSNGGRTRNFPEHDMEKWELFKFYNQRDVEVEQSIQKKLAKYPVPDFVWEEFWLDQEINDRGIQLDLTMVESAILLDEISKEKLSAAMKDITELDNPTVMEREYIYISTNHIGLYEKYGYEFYKMEKDIEGKDSRVYRKALLVEGTDKDRRYENGAKWKAQIVKAARKDVDMTAYCGFSCNHCFLGEWCGGCRSVFSCCSYGAFQEIRRCPNMDCCQEKEIDGCYECHELPNCTKGFYQPDNDGANACKAQAMFIRKYGKEKFLHAQDKLHEVYDFKKVQEVLGTSVEEGLKILEETLSEC